MGVVRQLWAGSGQCYGEGLSMGVVRQLSDGSGQNWSVLRGRT